MNGANARNYGLDIPFFKLCKVVGKDMSLLNTPYSLTNVDEIYLFPLERIDLICDFSNVALGTQFNVSDVSYTEETIQSVTAVLQVRVELSGDPNGSFDTVPSTLNRIKNLKYVYKSQYHVCRGDYIGMYMQ